MTVSYRNFVRGDPVAKLLVVTLKWRPRWIVLGAYLVAGASSFVIAIVGGRLLSSSSYTGLLGDGYYWMAEIFVGVAWYHYIWMCKAPRDVLRQLQKSGSITLIPRRQRAKISLWFCLALFFALVTCALAFFQMKRSDPRWLNINYYAMGSRVLFVVLPTSFAAWSFAFRVVTNTRIFAGALHSLILHPLHPDRLCGLRPLGKYALTSTYPIVLIGIVGYLGYRRFLHVSYGTAALAYAAIVIYFVLLPAIFAAPIWIAHKAMLRAKHKLMRPISEEFDKAFSLTLGNLRDHPGTLDNHLQRTSQLQKVHAILEHVPEWPVDFQILISLSPLALGIVIPLGKYLLTR